MKAANIRTYLTLPNIITVSRLALIPLFLLAFLVPFRGHFIVAVFLYIVASLTDLFDGYLARSLGQESALGRFLDPVADKLMVVVALIFLLWQEPGLYMAFPVAIIVSREITVSALREWMAKVGTPLSVSAYGKMKTIVQMVSISFLIGAQDESVFSFWQQEFLWWTGIVLLYLATVLTLWSMLLYLKKSMLPGND